MIHKNMWYISMVDLCVHSSNFGGTFMFTVFINFHVTLADFYPSYNPNIENIIHVTEFFCWVMGGSQWWRIFSFVSSSSILVTTDNQFWVRQKQNPISYFPAPIAFQTLQTCLWSYIQTWKRLTRIFARFRNETEIFINSIFCNKTYRALHLVVCTLRMEISSRNANSLRAFLERN